MKTRILVLLFCFLPGFALAQTSMTTTTVSSAVTLTDRQIIVASATGFAARNVVVIDNEAMLVSPSYSSGTTIPVIRGANGTAQQAHATSSPLFVGAPTLFYASEPPPGPCTSTSELALPRVVINRRGISVFNCSGGSSTTQTWQMYSTAGWPMFSYGAMTGRASGPVTYTALGAITPQPGMIFVNGTTLAMTIIDPTTAQNGMTMCVIATNASAHTLTYTAGFNGGTTSRDVATFGGAVGDNVCVTAVSGTWWVISTRNVTFG